METWVCPYTGAQQSSEACRNMRSAAPVVGGPDFFKHCRDCILELPGEAPAQQESASTQSTVSTSSTPPFKGASMALKITDVSPAAQKKIFAKLKKGEEWTGTVCGHSGKKDIDFYHSDGRYCKPCRKTRDADYHRTGASTSSTQSIQPSSAITPEPSSPEREASRLGGGGPTALASEALASSVLSTQSSVLSIDFSGCPEVLAKLEKLCMDLDRTPEMQARFILRRALIGRKAAAYRD